MYTTQSSTMSPANDCAPSFSKWTWTSGLNWMTDRLAAYQFRELESSERFGERIFWTNHFNERILELQYSKKNCRSHHPGGKTLINLWSFPYDVKCYVIALYVIMLCHQSATSCGNITQLWLATSSSERSMLVKCLPQVRCIIVRLI